MGEGLGILRGPLAEPKMKPNALPASANRLQPCLVAGQAGVAGNDPEHDARFLPVFREAVKPPSGRC